MQFSKLWLKFLPLLTGDAGLGHSGLDLLVGWKRGSVTSWVEGPTSWRDVKMMADDLRERAPW